MANKKLSDLSALSAAPAGADILAITDISTSLTKKVTMTELMESWATVETTHGTASIKDFGTSANELVSLDGSGLLPAVDGSQLTNVSATVATMGSGNSYAAGLVLAGSATHAGTFLRKDGTWVATLALGTSSSTALAGDTALLALGTSSSTALAGDTTVITGGQASAISANTAKVTFPGFGTSGGTALEGDTTLLALGTSSSTALAGDTTTIGSGQASAITANTAKDTNVPVATDVIWDTAGDLAVASGADAASKLGIGTAGHVLTVNSGGTLPEWAAASGGGGGGAYTINNKTADYTVASGDLGEVITVDGTYTVTIPATGISAGFYCTVVNLGTGIVTIAAASGAYLYNRKHHFRLNGKGTSARIICYAEDYYSLEGDVTGIDGLYLDVPGSADYFNADDSSTQIYMNSTTTTPMDAHWGTQEYLKITGDDITGNYKRYVGVDGESYVTTDIDDAFTSGSGASIPGVIDGDNYASYVWDNGASSKHTDGLYVYCGTGDTPTAVTVNDNSGAISGGIEILPVIYFVPSDYQASAPIWALSLYYDYGGSPTESGDAGGAGVVSQYGVAWWNPRGAGDRVEMSGHQDGSNAQAWGSYDIPKGYVYFS